MNSDFIIGSIKKMFYENLIKQFVYSNEMKDNRYTMWWSHYFEGTGLTKDGRELFGKIIKCIFESDEIDEIITRDEVEQVLREMLTDLLKSDKTKRNRLIIKKVNGLHKKFQSLSEEVELIFPILNLKLNRRKLTIGHVEFFHFTDYQMHKILHYINVLMKNNPYYKDNPTEIKGWINTHRDEFKKLHLNKTCAKVMSHKSPKKNFEDSIREIELSLACLKLYSNHIHIGNNCQFGLKGSIIQGDTLECIIIKKNPKGYKTNNGFVGFIYDFEIDNDFITSARSNGLSILNEIVKRKEITEIEKRILNSVCWYAKSFDVSLTQFQKDDNTSRSGNQLNILSHQIGEKFLKLVICLESLLLFDKFKENKRDYLKERSSLLILCQKKTQNEIHEFIEKSYNIRNKIVHQGNINVEYNQLIKLDFYVKKMIINLVKNYKHWGLDTDISLYKWFEKKRLDQL